MHDGKLAWALRNRRVEMQGLITSSYVDWTSDLNGEAYRLFIGGPMLPFFQQADGKEAPSFPVIYVLDAKLHFASVHAQVQLLSAMRLMPPAYVIGIGYAGDESFFAKDAFRRQGDLTPNEGGVQEADLKAMNLATGIVHGGAKAFLDVLTREVRLALETQIPIDGTDATLLGHSLGGLFTSWVLFHRPSSFQRYVIASPSWWWNDYEIWRWETEWAGNHSDLKASVFACFGGLETASEHREIAVRTLAHTTGDGKAAIEATIARSDQCGWMQGAELIPRFQATLEGRRYSGLRLTTMVFADELHESVATIGYARGLRSTFNG
mgnify:CR=1 FL=1